MHGGYGYTREYPVEQFYRDNRLNPIHEGAHGIQAIDLLGRKVFTADGLFSQKLMDRIESTIGDAQQESRLKEAAEQLQQAMATIKDITLAIDNEIKNGDKTKALANATIYLDIFGHLVVGWLWLRQGIKAIDGLAGKGEQSSAFYEGKVLACQYFSRYELPSINSMATLLKSIDTTSLDILDDQF